MTDLWIRPGTLPKLRNRLTARFHADLAAVRVSAPTIAALEFEFKAQATRLNGWDLITKRKDWFQDHVLAQLERRASELRRGSMTVFAYSYAADRIFKYARERGWRTVLGQIDPGPAEEKRVGGSIPAPENYWRQW